MNKHKDMIKITIQHYTRFCMISILENKKLVLLNTKRGETYQEEITCKTL
jgi:hypothetical protein